MLNVQESQAAANVAFQIASMTTEIAELRKKLHETINVLKRDICEANCMVLKMKESAR